MSDTESRLACLEKSVDDLTKRQDWTLSNERAHIESILCQRVNFLLVFVGLVLAAASQSKGYLFVGIVLTFGTIAIAIIAVPIFRAQHRLNINIGMLEATHVSNLIKGRANGAPCRLINSSRRNWVGYLLPIVCLIGMFTFMVLAWSKCF